MVARKAVIRLLCAGPISGVIALTAVAAGPSRTTAADSAAPTDTFAQSVAISGGTIVVGDSDHDGTGSAYVFTQNGTRWQSSGRERGPNGFGSSLAVSGSSFAVGTSYGRAYVYTAGDDGWHRTADLKSPDGHGGSSFGDGVALAGTTLAVAAVADEASAGRVFVVTDGAKGWSKTAELAGSDTAAGDEFGNQIGSSGGTVVVASARGQVYVFTEGPKGWAEAAELRGTGLAHAAYSGGSVALSGDTLVVGNAGYDKGRGEVDVFTHSTTGWRRTAELQGARTRAADAFGNAVAVSATSIVVGADDSEGQRGTAYVFSDAGGTWKQAAELNPSGTTPNSNFGTAVAISGTTIVVGTDGEPVCSLRINGGPSHTVSCGPPGSAGAYVYAETADGWHEVTDLQRPGAMEAAPGFEPGYGALQAPA